MPLLEFLSAGASILGGLSGMKKQKPLSPETIIGQTAAGVEGQAKGAREAGDKYGFNPLTLLGLGGAGVGSMAASGPPLASFDMISGGLRSLQEERSGENEQRRVRAGFENDLLRLEVDRLKSGGSIAVGTGGMRNVASGNKSRTGVLSSNNELGTTPNPITLGRETQVIPTANSAGVFEIENKITGGKPITVPGDSEPWGIDELATALIVGLPQVMDNSRQMKDPKVSSYFEDKVQKLKKSAILGNPTGWKPGKPIPNGYYAVRGKLLKK